MNQTGKTYISITTVLLILTICLCSGDAFGQARDKVQYELEKTDAIIERATEAIGESGSRIAEQRLSNAVTLQEKAWDRYRSGMLKQAATLTINARELAIKAIGVAQSAEERSELVQREIERTDELIRKSEERTNISESERAFVLLESAVKAQTEAREFFRANRMRIALTVTLNARETARKALELADAVETAQDRLQRELDRTDQLIQKAQETATGISANGQIGNLLQQAENLQQKAKLEYSEGRHRIALEETQRARDLAVEALELMEQEVQPDRIERYLDKTDQEIERLQSELTQNPNSQAQNLFDAAITHQEKARAAFAEGDMNRTVVEAKAARELTVKAIELIVD